MPAPTSKTAQRYAKALFDVGEENQSSSLLHKDMLLILDVCQSSRPFVVFLQNPIIPKKTKQNILREIFADKTHHIIPSFLDILVAQGRESLLKDIAKAFCKLYNESIGLLPVEIQSAVPISQNELQMVSEKLTSLTHKDIQFHESHVPSLIGGFRLQFDNMQYDASVKAEVEKLAKELSRQTQLP